MYKKILVAIDGSDPAKNAAEYAATSAEKWGADLLLLTVAPPFSAIYSDTFGYAAHYSIDYEKTLMSFHAGVLEKTKNLLKEKHPELDITTQIKKGHPARKIVEVSETDDVDLIVIGSRGHGGLTGWFLGSVSNYVVNHCTKPILVVK